MSRSEDKIEKSSRSIGKPILLSLIGFLVYSLCFLPVILLGRVVLYFMAFNTLWHFFLLPFIMYIGIILLIVSILLISGIIIKLFNIIYEPGIYQYGYNDKNSFRWMIICSLYTPCRKILEIIPMGKLKNVYCSLLGMKIGTNTLVGGAIKDPCVTEFGDNVTMGEYAVIYGHIHNYGKRTIEIKRVKIGNNCIIGAGSIIMPGAVMQEKSILAAGALVIQDQLLEKGKMYGGIPAKEIIKKPK